MGRVRCQSQETSGEGERPAFFESTWSLPRLSILKTFDKTLFTMELYAVGAAAAGAVFRPLRFICIKLPQPVSCQR